MSNQYLNLFNAIVDTNGKPDINSMDKIISIVHLDFPADAPNKNLMDALIKISANAEEFPFVKSVADKAIAQANTYGPEHNTNPVI